MATSTLGNGTLVLAGTTSGTTTVTATAVAGTTTLTLPAATDTLVGKATTDTLTNKTLTGAVMNGTLGATTPSTVAATTLTTSSTVTHNGGTANGVAYLNGSKVLTTGSALVFDGTNLGIGTTSPVSQLHITPSTANVFTEGLRVNREGQTGQYTIVNYASGIGRVVAVDSLFNSPSLGFFTSSDGSTQTERARIDSSGNLLVGTTSANSSRLNAIKGDATGPVIRAESSSGSFTGSLFEGYGGRTTTNGSYNLISVLNGDASGAFKVLDSGNAQNTNNSYGPIASDPRLKENITYDVNYLEDLMRLKVCKFSFKKAALDKPNQLGFLTDNIKEVFPKLIEKSGKAEDFGLPAGEPDVETYKASVLLPIAIRAIQEQQALITQLTARITALESA